MITCASFKLKFPEFGYIPCQYIEDLINEAQLFLDKKCSKYEIMSYYFIAHMLSLYMKGLSNTALIPASQTVGDVSVSYNFNNKNNNDFFLSTGYGQIFLQYKKACNVGVLIA